MRSIVLILFLMTLSGCASPGKVQKIEASPSGLVSTDPDSPKLTAPVVRKVWQEDKIEDGKYIQGHYIWVLERGSVWSMP
ncbi:hypothetical protein WDW37_18685 [Bdellovibrionota bacterium FG-1]